MFFFAGLTLPSYNIRASSVGQTTYSYQMDNGDWGNSRVCMRRNILHTLLLQKGFIRHSCVLCRTAIGVEIRVIETQTFV